MKDLFETSKGKYGAPVPVEDKAGRTPPSVEACGMTGANPGRLPGIVKLYTAAAMQSQNEAERRIIDTSLAAYLKQVNAKLDPHEQLDRGIALLTPTTVETGIVTPAMKVRRNRIEGVYAEV